MESLVSSTQYSHPASIIETPSIKINASERVKSRTYHTPYHTQVNNTTHLLKQMLNGAISPSDLSIVEMIEQIRPKSLRDYDQIPMHSIDLLRQVILAAPYLNNKAVAFVGDHDGTCLLFGILGRLGKIPQPACMLLLDFDERLLVVAARLAKQFGFENRLKTHLYNVFDPIPRHLQGQYDWFYTNPPYGCRNEGESVRLFINRGCELVRTDYANGCIILPHDSDRQWTHAAMLATQKFLCDHNWVIDKKLNQLHRYHLDDDQELSSSILFARYERLPNLISRQMPYSERQVDQEEIPHFYGRSVSPPYPRYIRKDGSYEYKLQSGGRYEFE